MKHPLPIPKGNSLFLALLPHGFSVVSNAFSSFRTTALPFMAFGLLMVLPLFLQAQFVPEGIHYQATALDAQGQPMANQNTVLRISLGSGSEAISVALYSEAHEVKTDDLGQFSLVIGQGKRIEGALASLPWAEEQIWLTVEMGGKSGQPLTLLSRSNLLAVPYAMHANTATQVGPGEEKNQSIYWLTGGNSLTSPPTRFLGTRDAQDFVIKTNDTVRISITKEGQYQIRAGAQVNGESSDINAYPLTIEGSEQGIYIKVNGSRDHTTNFLTFGDDQQFSWGRVEGQTFSELEATWRYQLQVSVFALQGASLGLRIAAWILQAVGETSTVCDGFATAGTVAQIIAFTVEAAGVLANSITWGVGIRREIGVFYASGAGDYAEWLPRQEGERDIFFGEIVGVTAGKVSLHTADADYYMAVSMRPAVLGNNPEPGKEALYEKIALMGQVPVRVVGPVSAGDYILPSGNHDGYGIAVHPQDMKSGDFGRVVGVAWQDGAPDVPFNYINTAVGINSKDLSKKVDLLNRRVENIVAYLEGKEPLLDPSAFASASAPRSTQQTQMTKVFTDEQIDQLLDRYEPFFKGLAFQVEKELKKQGYDTQTAYMQEFLDNPVPILKEMRRNPSFYTQWAFIDSQLPASK